MEDGDSDVCPGGPLYGISAGPSVMIPLFYIIYLLSYSSAYACVSLFLSYPFLLLALSPDLFFQKVGSFLCLVSFGAFRR